MRTIIVASLSAFAIAVTAYAADDSLDKAAKKTGDNLGELLKGIGQEIKKTGIGNDPKKDDKNAAKAGEGKEDKK